MTKVPFMLLCGSLVAAVPAVADACSPPFCWAGTHIPGDMSVVPANLPGVFWVTDDAVDAEPGSVRLVRVADDHEVMLELTTLGNGRHEVRILEELAPDSAHSLILGSTCGGTGLADESAPVFALTTAAASPLPDGGLGDLVAGALTLAQIELATDNGGCSESVESAYVDVTVAFDPAVMPWRDVLYFETLVDGKPWSPSASLPSPPPLGESWRGRGADRVFTLCEGGDVVVSGLTEGMHTVVIRARIPGTDVVLDSKPAVVQLSCDAGGESSGGEGTGTSDASTSSSGGTGEESTTAGEPTGTGDATGTGEATGTGDATGPGGATAGGSSGGSEGDGACACRTGEEMPSAPALACVLIAALARRRGRARQSGYTH